jgi:kinesin family protein C1
VAAYLTQSANNVQLKHGDLKRALFMLDERLTDMLESQKHVDKLRPLKTENKELLKLLRLEEKNSRQLLNKLQELKGNIRVLCRVRPLLAHEK